MSIDLKQIIFASAIFSKNYWPCLLLFEKSHKVLGVIETSVSILESFWLNKIFYILWNLNEVFFPDCHSLISEKININY